MMYIVEVPTRELPTMLKKMDRHKLAAFLQPPMIMDDPGELIPLGTKAVVAYRILSEDEVNATNNVSVVTRSYPAPILTTIHCDEAEEYDRIKIYIQTIGFRFRIPKVPK